MRLEMDRDELRPLIQDVVTELLTRLESERAKIDPGRVAYGEAEAARLLGLRPHQLRDERRRGRIKASVGPGRMVLYSRAGLLEYLASRPWSAAAG